MKNFCLGEEAKVCLDKEQELSLLLKRRRERCLSFLDYVVAEQTENHGRVIGAVDHHRLDQVNLEDRMKEIMEWESLLIEMWTRLEMDARKGDPSFPLKSERTPAQNWVAEHVMPSAVLREFLDIVYSAPPNSPESSNHNHDDDHHDVEMKT